VTTFFGLIALPFADENIQSFHIEEKRIGQSFWLTLCRKSELTKTRCRLLEQSRREEPTGSADARPHRDAEGAGQRDAGA